MKSFFSRLQAPVRQATFPTVVVSLLLLAATVPCAVGAPPANDNLANAQVIPSGSFSINGDSRGATTEAFEKASGYPLDVNANTVWYSWTPTIGGFLTTYAQRPNEGLNIGIFKGPAMPSAATLVAENTYEDAVIRNFRVVAGQQYLITLTDGGAPDTYIFGGEFTADPAFFTGETALANGLYYLAFPNGNFFGYYGYLSTPHFIYHFDLGYEYWFDAGDGSGGIYFYDFKSNDYFYTSPSFGFPYLYDFNLKAFLYYYPDPNNAGHYNTNGVRYFYNFSTGQIISK